MSYWQVQILQTGSLKCVLNHSSTHRVSTWKQYDLTFSAINAVESPDNEYRHQTFTQMFICFLERSHIQKFQRTCMFHPQASQLIQFYDAWNYYFSILLPVSEYSYILSVFHCVLKNWEHYLRSVISYLMDLSLYSSIRLFIHVWYFLFWVVEPHFYNTTTK